MQLCELSKYIKIIDTKNINKNKKFKNITASSKLANNNSILIIDRKKKFNSIYLKEAIKKKIPAIITNKFFKNINITQFLVENIDLQKSKILKVLFPNKPLYSIAITGTNGKTSVAWYIAQFCKFNKLQNKMLGTLGFYKNGKKIENSLLTTPSYEELCKFGCEKYKKNSIFIFEASSHGLAQDRISNFPVNIAAITNISNDHLDFHKTFKNYKKAKFKLFNNYLDSKGVAVINSRLKHFETLNKIIKQRKIKRIIFGSTDIYFREKKKELILKIYNKKFILKNLSLSQIEKENLECAIACSILLKISPNQIVKTLYSIKNPPGRLQVINVYKRNAKIIIDYAHTPDALEKVLKINSKKNQKPSVVFGCGGNRDISKRKKMAFIAKKYANKIYITDDNPRNENPKKIRNDLLKYCKKAIEINDRKKAIEIAIKDIDYNETLIIAGKGHEKNQILKNKSIKFDEVEIVNKMIKKLK